MKKKLLFILFLVFGVIIEADAQVYIEEDFENGFPAGWDQGTYSTSSTSSCNGQSIRDNVWSFGNVTNVSSNNMTSTGDDIIVSFDYKIVDYGALSTGTTGDFGDFYLQYSLDGGSTWSNYDTINEASHTVSGSCVTWSNTLTATDVPAGSDFAWKLDGTWTTGDYYVYIDDFSAIEQVSCYPVSDIVTSNITSSTAQIDWTENGTASMWNIEVGNVGFTPGSGNEIFADIGNTSQTSNATGLSGSTTYEVYIQTDCGGGDLSTWIGPAVFTTSCGTVVAPWSEDFENGGAIPSCWLQGPSNNKDWEFDDTGSGHIGSNGTINGSTSSGGYFAWLDDSGPHEIGTALLSPLIDVSGMTDPMMRFYLLSDNEGNTNVDFSIDVWDGSAWNNDVFTSNSNTANEAWVQLNVFLNNLTITGPIQFRFEVDENNGTDFYDDIAIDDVEVLEAPSCYPLSDLSFTEVGADSVVVNWTENGSSSNWSYEYGPSGFTSGSGTVVNTSFNPDTLTGLSPETDYDVYIWSDCGGGDLSDTISDSFTTTPSCLAPTALDFTDIGSDSVVISWTSNGVATDWSYEYGPSGFTQGSGSVVNTTDNPDTLTGLTSSTEYDVYLWSDCGGGDLSDTITGTFTTQCSVYQAPFFEGFDNGVQPDCWDNLSSDANSTDPDAFWDFDGNPSYEAGNNGRPDGTYAWCDASNPTPDSVMLITPNIDVSPLTSPYLEFDWFSNNDTNPGDNVPLIVDVFSNGTWENIDTLATDSTEWMTVNYDLSAYAGQVVKVQFRTNQTLTTNSAYYNDILLDNVKIDNCLPEPGQDGEFDVCRKNDTVNLNNNIIVKGENNGRWEYPSLPSLIVDDTVFNVSNLPADAYEVYYIVDGICSEDTTTATINVFSPSSAGQDGSIEVCLNEPVNLIQGLNGNVDLGGDWYDSGNNMLASGQIAAPSAGGNYNYDYITSNGVCPADTALVELIVDGDCDYLSLATEAMNEISIYPNPATEEVNIVNPANSEALKVEILDVNGRVVAVDDDALENTTEGTVAIDHLETGIYTIRIYNESGQKTFKLVKQ